MLRRRAKGRESKQAVVEADATLREVQARHHEVHRVSTSLRVLRQQNHFAEQLRVIMEGNR